jgi:hypothetical protein
VLHAFCQGPYPPIFTVKQRCVHVTPRPAHFPANLQGTTFNSILAEIGKESTAEEDMADLGYAVALAQQGHVKSQQAAKQAQQMYNAMRLKRKYGRQD